MVIDRPADRRLALSSARVDFLERGTNPELHGVPEVVAASWRRSVSHGVHPDGLNGGYSDAFDPASRLARCAAPIVEQLAEQIMDVPACVALTDENARIVSRVDGDPWIARLLDRVYFARGFHYAEDAVGTNGVGTVFESGTSVHIVGEEHFVSTLHCFACAGAPVRDPFTGRITGVLDISCLSDHSTPLFHSMVRSAAARIEHSLLLDRDMAGQALFDMYTRLDARVRDGVLAVGPRVVLTNAAMKTLVSPDDQAALEDHLRFVMERHDRTDDRVDLPSGVRVRVRAARCTVGGSIAGMAARVGPADREEPEPADRHGAGPAGRCASGSPSFRAAERTVAAALAAGSPVVVLGEFGSGRARLLADAFRRRHPAGQVLPIEPGEIERSPDETGARIRLAAVAPVLFVLRDVDRLAPPAAERLARGLPGGPGPGVLLAATATDGADVIEESLLRVFRVSATVPALRHRTADLPGIVADLLSDLAPHREIRLSREALRLLENHRWPGNVAELEGVLRQALRRRPVGHIEAQDLPPTCQSLPLAALRPLDQVERDAIVAALRDNNGNRKAAAGTLGLARSTLYRKIRQYGISG